jgi:hypothetical protein
MRWFALAFAFFQAASPLPRSGSSVENKPHVVVEFARPQDAAVGSDRDKTITVRLPPVDVNKDRADYVYLFANLLLTLTTLIIAVYAVRQANAAKKSADTYERTVKLTERADVLLDAAGLDTNDLGAPSRIRLRFKNFGRTRANKVHFRMIATIPELGDYPPNPLPTLPLGPGDTHDVVFMKMSEWLTKETFERILSGATTMRFQGTVTYLDVFEEGHTTACSGTFNPRTLTFGVEENKAD